MKSSIKNRETSLFMWNRRIQIALNEQKAKDRYRQRQRCVTQDCTHSIRVDHQVYMNFSSNDYLGLAHHPKMIEAAELGAKRFGVGSGGSPHVTGYSEPLAMLEEKLANWLGYDAAIVYPSGFTANQAAIKLLIARNDVMIADRLSHASLLEAAMFSPGRLYRFKHNDIASLESYLEKEAELSEESGQLVITEGIFSMDGDHAPLDQIAKVTQKSEALLMVDDAHGIGICGEQGRGSCDHYGIKPDILVVTFGKAFGCSGAALLLSKEFAQYFVQFSKPLIYSTAIPPMQAAILLQAMEIIQSQEGDIRRQTLARNIAYFRSEMTRVLTTLSQKPQTNNMDESLSNTPYQLPYLLESHSPIQPLVIGEDQAALDISANLRTKGIWVSAIRPPTVPPKTARLRMTITADHTVEMIDALVAALESAILENIDQAL